MGNIRAIGNDVYIYDTAGRLVSGTADVQRTGVQSRQDYSYDAFGNRVATSRAAGSVDCPGGCELPVTIDPNTNHINNSGAQYDAAGNLTSIQNVVGGTTYTATYSYDAAGRLARATANSDDRQFLYTADDERIATANGATWTWTIRGLDGKVLREFPSMLDQNTGLPTANRQWAKDYVWREGLLLASVTPTTPGATTTRTQHFHLDHLGTPRLVTGDNGIQLGIHAYYPFGAELNLGLNEQPNELMKFTGHERDVLASDPHTLDDMHARYEMGTLGRFLSVDPAEFWRLQDGNRRDQATFRSYLARPQVWNRYAYAANNPVSLIDADGRQAGPASLAQLERAELQMVRQGKMTRQDYENRARVRAYTGLVTLGVLTGSQALTSAWEATATWLGIGGAAVATASGTTVLLGENMVERVGPLAEDMEAATFDVPWTNMPDMLARNASWLQSQIDKGARIFDVGRDLARDPSVFYNAETSLLGANGYSRLFVKVVIVQGEVQPLYEWVKAAN
jgi:RHS repeat-associated protein